MLLSHQYSILFKCCSFISSSLYYSLSIYVAPCCAALLTTILLIGWTEAAARDGSHALLLNVLQHARVAPERETGTNVVGYGWK